MNRSVVVRHSFNPFMVLDVGVDVSMDELHFDAVIGNEAIQKEIANRTEQITVMLRWLSNKAKHSGFNNLRIVVEPTGNYHELLFRIATGMGLETTYVRGEAVKKMNKILHNDNGKTDKRDPVAIRELADRNIVFKHRRLPEIYQMMRRFNLMYANEEKSMIEAKCRIHRCLTAVFPDLSFKSEFVYSPSGRAIMQCYSYDPHAIVRAGLKRVTKRLKALVPRIRKLTIQRLMKYAYDSVQSTPPGRINDLKIFELRYAWDDMESAEKRRAEIGKKLENLYDEAREADNNLPKAIKGVVTKLALARLAGELGPLSDFKSCQQIFKFSGLNLRERESGKFKGEIKISKAGRFMVRSIVNQMVLPLVKRTRLFGAYYHFKTGVEKMKGTKAMTAVARKLLKMLWGLYKSGAEFSPERVFACESTFAEAA